MGRDVDDAVAFGQAVRAVIESIPAGEVMTYGEVALEAGRPGAARAVGHLLSASDGSLPWWRVVNATGRLVPGQERDQARHLRREGVALRPDGRRVAMPRR